METGVGITIKQANKMDWKGIQEAGEWDKDMEVYMSGLRDFILNFHHSLQEFMQIKIFRVQISSISWHILN